MQQYHLGSNSELHLCGVSHTIENLLETFGLPLHDDPNEIQTVAALPGKVGGIQLIIEYIAQLSSSCTTAAASAGNA